MSDQKSNLEPIEEGDLNLKEKFLGGNGIEKKEEKVEKIEAPERTIERKEGAAEKDDAYAKILSKVTDVKPAVEEEVGRDAEVAMQEKDAQNKVNNLVSIAETKGVAHAVKVARHMEDNYVLDEFHDKLLSDELHDFLVKKGLIKEL